MSLVSDMPLCQYRERGKICRRVNGHDGPCKMEPDPDATVIVDDNGPSLLSPTWQQRVLRWWRKLIRAVT